MTTIGITVWSDGYVMKGRQKRYAGESMRTFELKNIDTDLMSWIDFSQLLKENEVSYVKTLWYKFPDENEIYEFGSDPDWIVLVGKLNGREQVDVFVEHDYDKRERVAIQHHLKDILYDYVEERIEDEGNSKSREPLIEDLGFRQLAEGETLEESADTSDLGSPERGIGHETEALGRTEHLIDDDNDTSDADFIPSPDSLGSADSSSLFDSDEFTDGASEFMTNLRNENNSSTADISGKGTVEDDSEEELYSPVRSDEEDNRRRQPFRMRTKDKETNVRATLKLGDGFSSPEQFREALLEYVVQEGYSYIYKHNETRRIIAVCKNKCGWYIRASPCSVTGCFRIKSYYNVHKCGRHYVNRRVTSTWIANKILPLVKGDPDWDMNGVKAYMKSTFHLEVSTQQCYRAKRKAIRIIHGESSGQYKKIRNYCEAIMHWNPGSHAILKAENFVFQRVYVCLDACKRGFIESCRPLIAVDGCHLKSVYGGQLLCAVGKDANDNMYPISFAVVEIENEDSWRWFFECLKNDIGLGNEESWTFISDQQKGLVNSLNTVFPNDAHRICVRHLYGNFKSRFKGKELKEILWRAAQSTRERDFDINMRLMQAANNEAYLWLLEKNPAQWSRHAFNPRVKSDCLLSNIAESFNHWIGEARDKPILTLCETIRRLLMNRFVVKRDQYKDYPGVICPRIQKKLDRLKGFSKDFIVYFDGQNGHEVEHSSGSRYYVNIEAKLCACRRWELTGIPCPHACAAIFHHKHQPEDHVHPYYHLQTFKRAYQHTIRAMPGSDCWPSNDLPDLQPPVPKALAGRPKKVRRREADEPANPFVLRWSGHSKNCGSCGSKGHNSTTCQNSVSNPARAVKARQAAERARLYRARMRESSEGSSHPPTAGTRPPRATVRPSSQPPPGTEVFSQRSLDQGASSSQPVRNSGVFGGMSADPSRSPRMIRLASNIGGNLSHGVASRTRKHLNMDK